jgi:predicted acylesterase/phospholipase RssA
MAVLGTEDVLREEAKAIHGVDLSKATGAALYQSLNERNSAALCLSGGGIRSAAFALGVIQALAVHPPAGQ